MITYKVIDAYLVFIIYMHIK